MWYNIYEGTLRPRGVHTHKKEIYLMKEIKCPHCGEYFQIDESGYSQIVQQIRDDEFEKELKRRESELETKRANDAELLDLKHRQELNEMLAKKEAEISSIKAEAITLKAENEKLQEKFNFEKQSEVEKVKNEKDKEIELLKAELTKTDTEKELAVTKAVQEKDKEISEKVSEISKLQGELELKEKERALNENRLVELHKEELKFRDEEIERLKDFKAKLSTKMVGESLEQHCLNEFNAIRMTAFPKAYFEKDNDAKTGSKGDFIFNESDEFGNEFISIMFEMKNEMDATEKKHKNEDFFKELDKDRKEKNCEYAVLVSMLEADNEYYNRGIVDVSYKYPKMYVIRPQFFIPLITLLRNAALNSLQYQQELAVVRSQQVDMIRFEENMNAFKSAFSRNYELASDRFGKAIDEIDKTIKQLEKVRDALTSSERNLRLANDKAQDLSIKKLTKNAPVVRQMFENAGVEVK